MSLPSNQVTNFIVHKLIKEAHQRNARVDPRSTAMDVTPTVQRVVDHVHKLFADKIGKGYGRFEENEDEFPAIKYVRRYVSEGGPDFLEFSLELMDHLRARAEVEQLATGGYVLIAMIDNGATRFLLVAIVTETLGAAITAGMDVVDSVHLDMSHLRVAGRVDLSAWQSGADRYISFLKGRGDVADYFRRFLGCNDMLLALEESKKLVMGLERFADEQSLEPGHRDRFLESAHQYLEELSRSRTAVSLDELTNHLWPQAPDEFRRSLASDDLQLSDGFIPDRRATKALVKFEGKSRYWRLAFDRKAIRNGDLRYDEKTDTITLSNIPLELRSDLLHEISDEQAGV